MKIHCGQLVEGALRNALDQSDVPQPQGNVSPTLSSDLQKPKGTVRIVPLD